MRTGYSVSIGAALLLAACNGGGSADADGDGAVSTQEVADAAQDMVKPQPGQYEASYELLDFEVPGLPDAARQQMEQAMGGATEVAQGFKYCLTPEEAEAQGSRRMVENMAEGNCTFAKFEVDGGNISADMQCQGPEGSTNHVLMDGQVTSTGSTMTMTTEQEIGGRQMRMKTRVSAKRLGDCPAAAG